MTPPRRILNGMPAENHKFAADPKGFNVDAFLRRLEERVRLDAVQLRKRGSASGLSSFTVLTPELRNLEISGLSADTLFWSKPSERLIRIGAGRVVSWETSGANRLVEINHKVQQLLRNWSIPQTDTITERLAFLGWAFDYHPQTNDIWANAPNALLYVPELLLSVRGPECYLTFNVFCAGGVDPTCQSRRWITLARKLITPLMRPDSTRSTTAQTIRRDPTSGAQAPHLWARRVNEVNNAIACRELTKVVLSRYIQVTTQRCPDIGRMLKRLQGGYPQCTHFLVPLHDKVLIGVSPERLVSMRGGHLLADAIAGTIPGRGTDDSIAHTSKTRDLLINPKARHEQALVVDEIAHALAPVCHEIAIPQSPSILDLANVRHLWSPIRARVHEHQSLLDIAAKLHPTPAVCGTPTAKARSWIRCREGRWRGWYTGAVGWVGGNTEGELAVTLRCALLDGNQATLFAGAGIVRGSDPDKEYLETQWKLRSMLDALQHS